MTEVGRSGASAPSGSQAAPGAAEVASPPSVSIPIAEARSNVVEAARWAAHYGCYAVDLNLHNAVRQLEAVEARDSAP